jgi:outer membrane protein assembly factor BamB
MVFVSGLDYQRGRDSWPELQYAYAVVAALDAATGKPRWIYRDDLPSMPSDVGTAERAVAGTYADGKYFQSVPGTSVVFAFDARTGKVLWKVHTLAPVKMSPLYYRGQLYAGGNAGVLYVINASTGKLLRIKAFRQPFTASPPVLLGDTLLVSQNRAVQAVPLQSLSIAKH